MAQEIQTVLNILLLLIGIALVFWGLKIFKFYIILIGIAIGAVLGAIAGGLMSESPDASIVGIITGAFLGGIIAWPLQKFLVFLTAGFCSLLLGVVIMAALKVPQDVWLVSGLILFVIGGALAVHFYEYIVIILMAFSGAQMIFNAAFEPHALFSGRDPAELWQYLLQVYSERIVTLVFTFALFVWFALHFQKRTVNKSPKGKRKKEDIIRLHRLSYLLSFLAVLGYALMHFIDHGFSGIVLFGFNLFSWPVIATAACSYATWLIRSKNNICFFSSTSFCHFLPLLLFSLIVIPLITWCITCILNMRILPLEYYQAFFNGSPALLMSKWGCALLVFPGLLYLAVRHNKQVPAEVAANKSDTGGAEAGN
ncbi:DUF4203 domain-containing protein [bacterium]|nr:DUF4203 domain-containing protein [bacterium]